VTEVHATATEALASGEGVCQDHAHIFIAQPAAIGTRHAMSPGYLLLEDEQASEAHHAWAEVKIEGSAGSVSMYPTAMCPTERYIRLTTGPRFPFRCSYPGDPFWRAG
jgi:transglutaminase-like putative cysteine protease